MRGKAVTTKSVLMSWCSSSIWLNCSKNWLSYTPADIAYILEALPLEDRLIVWQLVLAESDGDILLEVSDAVRETLIADMDEHEIIAATKDLDADELADLAPELPRDVVQG